MSQVSDRSIRWTTSGCVAPYAAYVAAVAPLAHRRPAEPRWQRSLAPEQGTIVGRRILHKQSHHDRPCTAGELGEGFAAELFPLCDGDVFTHQRQDLCLLVVEMFCENVAESHEWRREFGVAEAEGDTPRCSASHWTCWLHPAAARCWASIFRTRSGCGRARPSSLSQRYVSSASW